MHKIKWIPQKNLLTFKKKMFKLIRLIIVNPILLRKTRATKFQIEWQEKSEKGGDSNSYLSRNPSRVSTLIWRPDS